MAGNGRLIKREEMRVMMAQKLSEMGSLCREIKEDFVPVDATWHVLKGEDHYELNLKQAPAVVAEFAAKLERYVKNTGVSKVDQVAASVADDDIHALAVGFKKMILAEFQGTVMTDLQREKYRNLEIMLDNYRLRLDYLVQSVSEGVQHLGPLPDDSPLRGMLSNDAQVAVYLLKHANQIESVLQSSTLVCEQLAVTRQAFASNDFERMYMCEAHPAAMDFPHWHMNIICRYWRHPLTRQPLKYGVAHAMDVALNNLKVASNMYQRSLCFLEESWGIRELAQLAYWYEVLEKAACQALGLFFLTNEADGRSQDPTVCTARMAAGLAPHRQEYLQYGQTKMPYMKFSTTGFGGTECTLYSTEDMAWRVLHSAKTAEIARREQRGNFMKTVERKVADQSIYVPAIIPRWHSMIFNTIFRAPSDEMMYLLAGAFRDDGIFVKLPRQLPCEQLWTSPEYDILDFQVWEAGTMTDASLEEWATKRSAYAATLEKAERKDGAPQHEDVEVCGQPGSRGYPLGPLVEESEEEAEEQAETSAEEEAPMSPEEEEPATQILEKQEPGSNAAVTIDKLVTKVLKMKEKLKQQKDHKDHKDHKDEQEKKEKKDKKKEKKHKRQQNK